VETLFSNQILFIIKGLLEKNALPIISILMFPMYCGSNAVFWVEEFSPGVPVDESKALCRKLK